MTEYYRDPTTDSWQPERRQFSQPAPTREQRRRQPVRTTSEQYTFLRDWLERRENLHAHVGKRSRFIRHVLASISLLYIALYFSQPDFQLSFRALGLKHEITLAQIGAIAPLIISYLVLHACHLSIVRMKLRHDCRIVERELQRFGSPTGYSLLNSWRDYCKSQKGVTIRDLSTKSIKAENWLYDAFLAIAVMVSFFVSIVLAVQSYRGIYASTPHMSVMFFIFLGIGIVFSLSSLAAFQYGRRKYDAMLEAYLETLAPAAVGGKRDRESERVA